MTPERYKQLQEHAKAGAHAVATLADVDELRAEMERAEAELDAMRAAHAETQKKLASERAMREVAEAFHDLVVKERDLARFEAFDTAQAAREHDERVRAEERERIKGHMCDECIPIVGALAPPRVRRPW